MVRRVTLKDVAQRAGVSYQTVSKILRGTISVTPEVRARVQAAIEELGYHPDITARNLRTKSTRLIGYSWQLDLPDHINPILEQFLQSIVATAESYEYHIMLFPQRPDRNVVEAYQQLVRTGRVDGFILSSLNYDDPRIPVLQDMHVPFVAFGRARSEEPFPYVDVDNRDGLRQATEHLLAQGHRRVAAIAWPENSRVGNDRLAGYVAAMQTAGLDVDPDWICRGEGVFTHGYEAARALLALPEARRPTAIVTMLDLLAIGAMRAVQEFGLRIGPDIAITGFDDTPIIPYLKPSLTSVRQPAWEIGQVVVMILVALLEGKTLEQQQVLIPPKLIVRESSVSSAQGTADLNQASAVLAG